MNIWSSVASYPNLGLLEYKARQIIECQELCKEKIEKINRKMRAMGRSNVHLAFKAEVFLQTWGSTSLGFDTGNEMSGQAITDAYTTVIEEINTEVFCIFFGDRLAYMVYDANDSFKEDLKNRSLASCRESKLRY